MKTQSQSHPAVKNLKFKTNIDGALNFDTQSALAENNFYKTSDGLYLEWKLNWNNVYFNCSEYLSFESQQNLGLLRRTCRAGDLFLCWSSPLSKIYWYFKSSTMASIMICAWK